MQTVPDIKKSAHCKMDKCNIFKIISWLSTKTIPRIIKDKSEWKVSQEMYAPNKEMIKEIREFNRDNQLKLKALSY